MLIKSFFTVSSLTLLSRILGFVRDVLMARMLGASMLADAFFVAFKIPNLLRRLFAEGAFSVAFIPILARMKEEKNQADCEAFASVTLTWLALILLVVTVLAETFMPAIVTVLAPGFLDEPEKFTATVFLARITFPYLPLIAFVVLAGSIGNTFKKFSGAALAPSLLNISFIFCLVTLPLLGLNPATSAAIAVPFGGVLQAVLMGAVMRKIGFKLRLTRPRKHSLFPKLLKRIGPAALGVGVLQLSTLIDMFLASLLAPGSISYLFYADRLNQLPLALIGITLGTILLPHLSAAYKKGETKKAEKTLRTSLTVGGLLGGCAAVGLSILAVEIMQTLFGYGAFDNHAARMSGYALAAYAVGLPAYVLTKITATVFYAQEDTATPVKISAFTLFLNLILNLALMPYFQHVGLALATSLSAWAGIMIHLHILKKKGWVTLSYEQFNTFLKIVLIGSTVFIILLLFKGIIPFPENIPLRILWLTGAIFSAIGIAGVGTWGSNIVDIKTLLSAKRNQAKKQKTPK